MNFNDLLRDAQGSVIDVSETAAQLLRSYPDAGMTLQEIVVHIETMGVIVGAMILSIMLAITSINQLGM